MNFADNWAAVMLRDIADAFDEQPPEGESSCGCC